MRRDGALDAELPVRWYRGQREGGLPPKLHFGVSMADELRAELRAAGKLEAAPRVVRAHHIAHRYAMERESVRDRNLCESARARSLRSC